ncbi:hypothetical protein Bca52824_038231 [Brassica carinata]|uniref:F-box associated beta-propeller type 3 domain-containing protein n=1 Tax=Brassica carinata TaxID=52824 RepID=A0A8X7RP79_BRACI|nr:hypothetical protein Bca52824_038231 [Brassica carinata]
MKHLEQQLSENLLLPTSRHETQSSKPGWKRKVPVICNPATGEFLTLPKVLLKEKKLPKVKAKSNPTEMKGMYLGYDPLGKQFKVLCMTWSRDERPNTHQVLTLESGKRLWRTLEHKFHFVNNGEINGDICIDGVLYFRKYSKIVVCFDVRLQSHETLKFVITMKRQESPSKQNQTQLKKGSSSMKETCLMAIHNSLESEISKKLEISENAKEENDEEKEEGSKAETSTTKKKKNKNKSKKKPQQTDLPTIPIVKFFPSGDFTEGEIQQYKDE